MDFTKLDTKTPAEAGNWLHLCRPYTEEKLYSGEKKDGKPCRVMLRGLESASVQKIIKRQKAAEMTGKKSDIEQAERDGLAFAQSLVIDFQNIERGDKPLSTSKDDVEWFFDLSADFVRQVMEFAADNQNFLPETSPN